VNEGIDKRETAVLLKEGLCLQNVKRLPSGRGITGLFKDTWIMNMYALSGAEKKDKNAKRSSPVTLHICFLQVLATYCWWATLTV